MNKWTSNRLFLGNGLTETLEVIVVFITEQPQQRHNATTDVAAYGEV